MITGKLKLYDEANLTDEPIEVIFRHSQTYIELELPDGQIIRLEKFMGKVQLLHWADENDDKPTITKLT